MYDLMLKENFLWQQRSRVDWLKSGDPNTRYFHSRATQRNRRNFISKLVLEDGTRVEDKQEIVKVMVDYFKTCFTSTNSTSFDSILDGIDTKVTTAMNAELTKCFTAVEVEQALKQMKPMTTPGLDGIPPLFYKSYWSTVGPEVIDATLSILISGTMPPLLNHTFISLIPKLKNSEKAKDFRPISLYNVMHKLISKTIANRLKKNPPKTCV